jgi:hypothetical protein
MGKVTTILPAILDPFTFTELFADLGIGLIVELDIVFPLMLQQVQVKHRIWRSWHWDNSLVNLLNTVVNYSWWLYTPRFINC